MAKFRPVGPVRAKTVAKVRRNKVQAYGTSSEWSKASAACIKRAGGKCAQCGRMSAAGNRLNAHHIIPVSKGGKTTQWNLKCLCERCHSKQPGHEHMRHKH